MEKPKCTQCGLCVNHCKVDIRHVGDGECISCGECVDVCPTKAIVWKGSHLFLKKNEGDTPAPKKKKAKLITRCISGVLMLALLVGAVWYSWPKSDSTAPPISGTTPSGTASAAGSPYSAELQLITADGISTETVDPTKTGQLTIVNFWGTWCDPCVKELPDFDQFATDYEGRVTVIAVHTNVGCDTAPEFILEHYPESRMCFAKDFGENGSEVYYTTLGGLDAYPYTVILDAEGAIVESFMRPIHYEDLQAAIEPYLAN